MNDYKYAKDENGWPLISECNKLSFTKYFTSAESLSAYEMLYNNGNGLTDKFLAFWDKVANYF